MVSGKYPTPNVWPHALSVWFMRVFIMIRLSQFTHSGSQL
jgi:hypothetical protein